MPSPEVEISPRRHRRRRPAASTFTNCCCSITIAAVLLLSFVPTQAVAGASVTAQQTPSSHADQTRIARHVFAERSTRQKESNQEESSDLQVETSPEVDEEENTITSQDSSDEAPGRYVAHHIDGYGSITSCMDEQTSSAGRDIEGATQQQNYETIDLEIKFDYQIELISLISDEDSADTYNELIVSTERTMHHVMVDNFLDCKSGATDAHGMDKKRKMTDAVVESLPPSPQIVGISSAPQDAISLTDSCATAHTTEDNCVVINAAATVTVDMDGITNAELLSEAIDVIRSSILEKIETDMEQGQYDEQYGRNLFAKISFVDANPVGGDAQPQVASGSSASLREESHVRHRRRNVRAVVVVIGMTTIAVVFKLISYSRELRSNTSRSDSNDKKSWRKRIDNTKEDDAAEDAGGKRKKKERKMPKYDLFGNTGSDGSASIVVEEVEEIDESQNDDFEENELESIDNGNNDDDDDDDDWTYDEIGRQESREVLDLESGTLQMTVNGNVCQINDFDETWHTFWLSEK